MPTPWQSPHSKLNRAAHHFVQLHRVLRTYIREQRPFEYKPEMDVAAGYFGVRVEEGDSPPDELSLIVGDFVQNLRAALDHIVCQAVLANGSAITPRNAFPILTSEPTAANRGLSRRDAQLQGTDPKTLELVEMVQPYRLGPEADRSPLACLQKLSNEDKHRVVLQRVHSVPSPEEAPPQIEFEFQDVAPFESYELHAMKPLRSGNLLLEAEIEATGPSPRVSFQGAIAIDVAFGVAMIPAAELETMFDRVDVIVAHLANELLGASLAPHPVRDRLGDDPIFEPQDPQLDPDEEESQAGD